MLAGQRPGPLLAARLSLIALAAAVATVVSLAVTATVSDVRQWGVYIVANVLVAATYALIGALLGPLLGRVAGVFIAFLIPLSTWASARVPCCVRHRSPGRIPARLRRRADRHERHTRPLFDETRSR